jgi:methionyl-tRNA formyltransferase
MMKRKKKKTMHNPLFAFFGTPQFAVEVLDRLEAHAFLPALVVTTPDKPSGRGMELKPSPAKQWALERGIDVATTERLKGEAFVEELQNTQWDVFITAAYAKIIPKVVLDIPTRGCLNVHPSLLPALRGPSPALSAILADMRETGVTIMQMDEKMDEGPIVAQARIEFSNDAWPPKGSEFETFLAQQGGDLLSEVLPDWVSGSISPEPQDHASATYTKKFTDEDARLDLAGDPRHTFLQIRAFDKSPRPYFLTPAGKRVIVTDAECTDGQLHILRVIPEGKKEMAYADFLRGQKN